MINQWIAPFPEKPSDKPKCVAQSFAKFCVHTFSVTKSNPGFFSGYRISINIGISSVFLNTLKFALLLMFIEMNNSPAAAGRSWTPKCQSPSSPHRCHPRCLHTDGLRETDTSSR